MFWILMKTLRLLALHHTMPNITSVVTLFFKNLLPALKTRRNVHMIWVVYTPDKINLQNNTDPDTTILDIHDYKNALEILQREKPDIIFAGADHNFIDYAFSIAGKFLGIPVVSGHFLRFTSPSKTKLFISSIPRFFDKSLPIDTDTSKKQIMRRGRFFVYKYIFLLKTQKSLKMSKIKILKNTFMLFNAHFNYTGFWPDPRFKNTLHWVDGEEYFNSALASGFERSRIVLTGNPLYDPVFQKLQSVKHLTKNVDKIKVLFVAGGHAEHGLLNRKKQDDTIRSIVQEINKHKDEITLVIKLHPSSTILSEYQTLISAIDPSIQIFQSGDILEFLNDTDVVLGFQTDSALEYALLSKIPIVICNFFNFKNDPFVERSLVLECKEISNLIQSIKQVFLSNPASQEKFDKYIKDCLYKADGKASERLCDVIINLHEKTIFAKDKNKFQT